MAIDDEIGDEKLQGNKNGEAEKISVLSSWKSDKYEYLTDEEILSLGQKWVKEQLRYIFSSR